MQLFEIGQPFTRSQNRREGKHVRHDTIPKHKNQEPQGPLIELGIRVSRYHSRPRYNVSFRHFIEQYLCFFQEVEFDIHIDESVDKKRFGVVPV